MHFSIAAAVFGLACLAISETVNDVKHTFYGYPDNSPPGAGTAYSCGYGRGHTAGGHGSYDDPKTFATAPGEFDKCEIIWDPYTKKYLIFQDTCSECISNWKHGKHHIDLWLGPTEKNYGQTVIDCEDALTPDGGQPVERNPPTDYDASTKPLFNNPHCETDRVYPQ